MENQLLYELYRTYADEIALYLYSLCKDRSVAEYVGQHGMRFMGIAVYGSRETLQKLLDHPLVSMVTLEQE